MNRSSFDHNSNLYSVRYTSTGEAVHTPFLERDFRATPVVYLQRRRPSGKQRLSICCYSIVLIISVVLNFCLTVFLSVFVYEKILNVNVTISNIFYDNNEHVSNEKTSLEDLDKTSVSTCSDIGENSICFVDGNLMNFNGMLQNGRNSWLCAKNRKDLKFLSMMMKPKEGRLIPNRSLYFTKIDVENQSNNISRLPLSTPDSRSGGVLYSKNALVIEKSGVFFLYLSLTLNLQEDRAHPDLIHITVIREDRYGRKMPILKKTVVREIKYFHAFENVFLSDTFRLLANDKVYVVVSEPDVIWQYSDASWLGILEV